MIFIHGGTYFLGAPIYKQLLLLLVVGLLFSSIHLLKSCYYFQYEVYFLGPPIYTRVTTTFSTRATF